MANAEGSLSSLALSAYEVKSLTGWDDAMVEDYLTIIRNLSDLSEIIDENEVNIFRNVDKLNQETPQLKRAVAKAMALTEKNRKLTKKNEQLSILAKSTALKATALANLSLNNTINYNAQKGLMIAFSGNDTFDPVLISSYNLSSLNKIGAGQYQAIVNQSEMFGQHVFDDSIHSITFNIEETSDSGAFVVKISKFTDTIFYINSYQVLQDVGDTLTLDPYDLQVGDRVSVSLDLTIGSRLPQE